MQPNRKNSGTRRLCQNPELWNGIFNRVMQADIEAKFIDFDFKASYTKMTLDIIGKDGKTIPGIDIQVIRPSHGIAINGETKSIFDWALIAIPNPDCFDHILLEFDHDNTKQYITGTISIKATIPDEDNNAVIDQKASFRVTSQKHLERIAGIKSAVLSVEIPDMQHKTFNSPMDLFQTSNSGE